MNQQEWEGKPDGVLLRGAWGKYCYQVVEKGKCHVIEGRLGRLIFHPPCVVRYMSGRWLCP